MMGVTISKIGPLSISDSKSQRNAVIERLSAFALVSPCLHPRCNSKVRATVSRRSSSTKSLLNREVLGEAACFPVALGEQLLLVRHMRKMGRVSDTYL